jgi:hypothetical protein
MFTPEERARLRSDLLERAAGDRRIVGAAITGSAAAEREDRWSDVDLAFGVDPAGELPQVLVDWTAHMYERHLALHHVDVKSGVWIYRVFLLSNTLQVDLAFTPMSEFRATAPTFRLAFGNANEPRHAPPPSESELIGLGWLYALHARSSIARQRLWQAEYMISGMRDHALALACVRHGLPASYARGVDRLPRNVTAPFEDSLVRRLNRPDLSRAFKAVTCGFLVEIRAVDGALAARLERLLMYLTEA